MFGTRHQLAKIEPLDIKVGPAFISLVEGVRNLWFYMDNLLKNHHHINRICSQLFSIIKSVQAVWSRLDHDTTKIIIQALVLSKLDYCNLLLAGSAKYQLKKLQRVPNMACRVINNLRKYDHISASIMGLHWLKVKECIECKIACLVFRCRENIAPNYLADLLPTKTSNRDLRSTNSTAIPILKCKNIQTRQASFAGNGPDTWNSLPCYIRQSSRLLSFKKLLKTHLLRPHMANTNLPPIIVKHFSTGIASSGKCYIIYLFIYLTVKLTPIVLDDYLMLILTIPLIDQSLHMNLYKVHNLPMLHPTLNVHVQYELEGSYLATMMEGMFISLPTALDVKLCLITNGNLCMFNQALYPVDHTKWGIYALFINDKNQIKRNCFLKTLNRTINLAYSLDGYLWAISALETEKLQVRCVMETHVITIKPPLQIFDIGNGCEAYSASIYILAKSELMATLQSIT